MKPQVICFGEVLWDLLPTGKVAGGAPMNVAFQLNQLGITAGMISRIGTDELGKEISDFLKNKNVPTKWVQQDEAHPTGIVQVELNEKGHPQYDIVSDVAWDFIATENNALEVVKNADAFVFGSLVARNEASKNTLLTMLEYAAIRVFDVNLRQPFFSKEMIGKLLLQADIVKMNDDELEIIAGWQGYSGDFREKMSAIKKNFQIDLLVVTQGAEGATSLGESGFCKHAGYCVRVQDTIGSGDAFLAGYLSQFFAQCTPEKCLDFACKMGAYVATKRGGTPVFHSPEFAKLSLSGY